MSRTVSNSPPAPSDSNMTRLTLISTLHSDAFARPRPLSLDCLETCVRRSCIISKRNSTMEPLPKSIANDIEDASGVEAEESSDSSLENTNEQTDHDDVIVEAVPTTKPELVIKDGLFSSQSRFVARKPWLCFGVAFLISTVLSVIGLIVGDFQVAADNAGWRTRGTLIADRHQQVILVLFNRYRLFYEGESAWEDLTNNVQSSWEGDDDDEVSERQLAQYPEDYALPLALNGDAPSRIQNLRLSEETKRRLQDNFFAGSELEGCDPSW